MVDKRKKRSSWDRFILFPQKFSYEIDAPIDAAIRHLADIEQEPRMFRSSQEVSILPVEDHYVFRIRRRRHGTLIVSAEGQISQDEAGCVLVEGETRINSWSWIASLVLMSFFGVVVSVASMPPASRLILLVPFFITMLLGFATSLIAYRRDRQQLVNTINDALSTIKPTQVHDKHKRISRLTLEDSDSQSEEQETANTVKNQRHRNDR